MITSKSLQLKLEVGIFQFPLIIAAFYALAGLSGCKFRSTPEPKIDWDTLTVNASAYNSLKYQTGPGDPNVTAFGDTIAPGMKIIAVSRDLLKSGLKYNTRVRIKGFQGEYLVKDKMHYRWKNKIDIYMGDDIKRARKWGRKKIEIYYTSANEEEQDLTLTK